MKHDFKERIRQNRMQIFLLILICSILIPVLLGSFYCVPCGDDYFNTMGWFSYTGNRLLYPIEFMTSYYMNWQGTYFAALLGGIPLFEMIGLTGFRWVMFFVILFFISAYLILLYGIVSLFRLERKESQRTYLLLFLTGIAYVFGTNRLTEIFYWYTGMQAYTLPLTFAFLGVYSYIRYELSHKNRYLVCGCLCAVAAAGGALNAVALFCTLMLGSVLANRLIHQKWDKGLLIALVALAGALTNALAPGNFIRHSMYEERIGLPAVLVKTVARVGYSVFSDLRSGTLMVLILILFLYAYTHFGKLEFEFKYPGLIAIYSLFAVIITDFPFVLGTMSTLMSSRGKFVEHVCIMIYASLTVLYFGGWAAKKKLFRFSNTDYLIIVLGMTMFLLGPYAYDVFVGFTPYRMAIHMMNGDFKEISRKEEMFYEQLRSSEEPNVVLQTTKEREGQWVNFMRLFPYPVDMSDIREIKDEELYASRYYHKNSIIIRFSDE